jgi:uncharacterized protein (TIGR00251 family)
LSWYRISGSHAILQVHAQPGAKYTEVVGVHGDSIKIRLASPPVDGRANQCLKEFLAERLGVKKNQVSISQGLSARRKTVQVTGSGLEPGRLLDK